MLLIIPILQMRKLSHRELKQIAQEPITSKWQSQNSNPQTL